MGRLQLSLAMNQSCRCLQSEMDINSKDNGCGKIPLLWVAEMGHEAVMRLLIERDMLISTLGIRREGSCDWA